MDTILPSPNRYLFVASHPGDLEISCMGLIIKLLRDGDNIGMLVLSEGTMGADPGVRSSEQESVFSSLLDKYENRIFLLKRLDLEDGALYKHQDTIRDTVEGIIHQYGITKVVTHYPEDTHRDHRIVSQAVSDASRKVGLMYFESVNSRNFIPNLFIELDREQLDEKMTYVNMHDSQVRRSGEYFPHKIEAMSFFHGTSIYRTYAEAYCISRIIF